MQEAMAAGDATQAQVYADELSSILLGCVEEEQRRFKEYIATNDQEKRAELRDIEELNERLSGMLRGLGGTPVTEEERDQAQGETA
jgi:anti-sigma factor RsiW